MNTMAIRVEGLGKRYRLGAQQHPYNSLREALLRTLRAPARRARALRRGGEVPAARQDFWALKDVSFSVEHGDVLGIIGRNGAGKSTLLKVLSEITEPTEGRIAIRGRVASLLEVGTGFHPELTGRENIVLNGAILGMSRAEIARKFEEIVAFAEVEQFIDTQVKHYSSGMYLRLAFAVAAHLEPEILIVDEVLAVGDASFQAKCLGKMKEARGEGRTVLFVSHDLGAITQLCPRSLLLDRGHIVAQGPTSTVIADYLSRAHTGTFAEQLRAAPRRGRGVVRFTAFEILDAARRPVAELAGGHDYTFQLQYASALGQPLRNCRVLITVNDRLGRYLFTCSTDQVVRGEVTLPPSGTVEVHVPHLPLSQGRYTVQLYMDTAMEIEDWYDQGLVFTVIDGNFYPQARRQYPEDAIGMGVLIDHHWSLPALS